MRLGVLARAWRAPALLAGGALGLTAPAPAAAVVAPLHGAHADQTWGGYALTGKTFTSITGSWNIPSLDCAKGSGSVSPWIGIDGWSTATVEQIGLDFDCSSSGRGSYHPWVEMYPGPSDYFTETVKAGDTMQAAVSVSGSSWTLTETDTTQGWTKTFRRTSTDKLASAEAIVEDLGSSGAPPVDDFGTVTFTNLVVNGTSFFDAGTSHVTTLERATTKLSKEAELSATSCSITWLHR